MPTPTTEMLAHVRETSKPFDAVVADLEAQVAEHKFRVLHVHDVQATLKEKGFERSPLKIVEVCNAGFASQALGVDDIVAVFMPCRYTVRADGAKTVVALGRPSMIAQMIPDQRLSTLAADVEATLISAMEKAL